LLKDHVDIVEAGTILCLSEGLHAVRALRAQCPEKIIVADWKVADAGETLARQALDAGANWMTIICAAPLATIEKGHAVAAARGEKFRLSCLVTGPSTMPATGTTPACVRPFTTVVVTPRRAASSGVKRTWRA
jgi:3-keto-L-gulonate-6-phosphate decarboxylase